MLRLCWLAASAAQAAGRRLWRDLAAAIGPGEAFGMTRHARLGITLMVSLPIAMAAALLLPNIVIVMSPSIDAWLLRRAPGPVSRGDLVSFTLTHPIAGAEPVNVTKKVRCMPGELLRSVERISRSSGGGTDGWYYCGDRFLAISRPRTRDGRALAHLNWGEKRIPAGYVYLGSDHPDGFDSRYYGLVATRRLTRMEKIL